MTTCDVCEQDMMNRRISMKLMMDCALDQKGKQFIFLTPQDMRCAQSTCVGVCVGVGVFSQ